MIEEFTEDVRNYFYDNGDNDIQVEVGEYELTIYLDLPSTENYDTAIDRLEQFFVEGKYDYEDFSVDGDYEGIITIYSENKLIK